MPEIITGFNTEQKALTVLNTDTDINNAITAQAADSWLVSSFVLFNSDASVIILFTRTVTAAA